MPIEDQEPNLERVYKFGDIVKLPVMEGLDQMEPWMFVRIEGGKVFLQSTLVEDRGVIKTINDPLSGNTVQVSGKTIFLEELRKYNK